MAFNTWTFNENYLTIKIPNILYIHSLHFHLALLQWRHDNLKIDLSMPLHTNQVLSIKKNDDGHNPCNEYTNLVYYDSILHCQKIQRVGKRGYYVQNILLRQ